jgi:formate hydrogenlyase transcriptional activator
VANAIRLIAQRDSAFQNEPIGHDQGLRQAWNAVLQVAPTDAAVLIQGETGAGKELIARAVHEQSLRRRHPYVRINCAAMPAGLLESELFGHERGAYTGAVTQTAGRFQLADSGTLFLDEIGELPLELQPKLLRVLQEQEFERLGSGRTIRVDVRIIAATNQDLGKMVRERKFRADLYYRLNVFPIDVPPLRRRVHDIPCLVHHFVAFYAGRMNKHVPHVPDHIMRALMQYDWPGNVRELQNVIERSVITSQGSDLCIAEGQLENCPEPAASLQIQRLADVEKEHIVRTLQAVRWVVGGRNGAAARLGLPRTTLLAKMQKLGIPTRDERESAIQV